MTYAELLDEAIKSVRWGDYQREDGTWGYGIANADELKAKLLAAHEAAVREARLDELNFLNTCPPPLIYVGIADRIAALQGEDE